MAGGGDATVQGSHIIPNNSHIHRACVWLVNFCKHLIYPTLVFLFCFCTSLVAVVFLAPQM